MATFVRNHPTVVASTSGTTAATALAAAVPAGRLLVATLVQRGTESVPVASLTKPVGESANWVKLVDQGTTTSGGNSRAVTELWAIRTTVDWAGGFTITAAWSGSPSAKRVIGVAEFSGVTTTVTSSASSGRRDPVVTAATTVTLRAGDLVVQAAHTQGNSLGTETSGGTATATRQNLAGGADYQSTAFLITGSGGRSVSFDTGSTEPQAVLIVGLLAENYPPNAPTLTTMAAGNTIDRASINRAAHTFSDPNPGDSQSAFDLRYRLVGAGSWTNVYVLSPNPYYDFPAGALAAGSYERQVRTYDSLGAVGPWSASGFFTAATVPVGPTITYPVSGQFVQRDETLVWSAPAQAAYQVRRVGDTAGSPDTATVYFDTGEITDTATRSLALTFGVNARTEHVQVRVKNDGLWSPWATAQVNVSYTPPPAPAVTFAAEPATASLLITTTNPTPTGSQPATAYNDIYVDDGDGEERKATRLPTNSTWRYFTPRSGRDYASSVRVVAVATNGTTASSS